MKNAFKGMLLAMAAMLPAALYVGVWGVTYPPHLDSAAAIPWGFRVFAFAVFIGSAVAVPVGGVLGYLAGHIRRWRLVTLEACGLTAVPLAAMALRAHVGFANLMTFAGPSIPFVAMGLWILERWTRPQDRSR